MLDILLSDKVIHPIIIIASLWLVYFIYSRIIRKISKTGLKTLNQKKNKTIISLINNLNTIKVKKFRKQNIIKLGCYKPIKKRILFRQLFMCTMQKRE